MEDVYDPSVEYVDCNEKVENASDENSDKVFEIDSNNHTVTIDFSLAQFSYTTGTKSMRNFKVNDSV